MSNVIKLEQRSLCRDFVTVTTDNGVAVDLAEMSKSLMDATTLFEQTSRALMTHLANLVATCRNIDDPQVLKNVAKGLQACRRKLSQNLQRSFEEK